jgi:hypothetical protein
MAGLIAIGNYTVTSEAVVNTSWNTFQDCFMIYYQYAGPNMGYNETVKYMYVGLIVIIQ